MSYKNNIKNDLIQTGGLFVSKIKNKDTTIIFNKEIINKFNEEIINMKNNFSIFLNGSIFDIKNDKIININTLNNLIKNEKIFNDLIEKLNIISEIKNYDISEFKSGADKILEDDNKSFGCTFTIKVNGIDFFQASYCSDDYKYDIDLKVAVKNINQNIENIKKSYYMLIMDKYLQINNNYLPINNKETYNMKNPSENFSENLIESIL